MSNFPPPGSTGPTRPMNTQPQNPQPTNPPPYQQGYYQQNPYPQGQQPPKKGGGGLKWVLLGCGGFIIIGILVVGGIGYLGYQKAKQAGLDPELMQRNPALAAAKIAMMNNPDVEFVRIDESKNTITVKDKKTGKEITISAEKAKDGRIVITEDGKEKVSIQGGPNGGSIEVNNSDEKVKIGNTSNKLPDWLPQYPGVEVQGTYSTENAESSGAGFHFATDDSIDEVMDFYEDALKEEGFKISKSTTTVNGKTSGSLSGNDPGYKRHVVVSGSIENGETKVHIVSQTKK
jgi:hypothetical protein